MLHMHSYPQLSTQPPTRCFAYAVFHSCNHPPMQQYIHISVYSRSHTLTYSSTFRSHNHPLAYPSIHALIYSCLPLTQLPTDTTTHSHNLPLTQLPTHTTIHSCIHRSIHPSMHSYHLFMYLSIYSFFLPFTHPFMYSPISSHLRRLHLN